MKIHNQTLLDNFGKNGKLNIALVTDAYYPLVGGATVVVESLAKALSAYANVVVVAPGAKEYMDNAPFPIIRCKALKISDASGWLAFPKLDSEFRKFIKTLPLDIVHCHTVFSLATYFRSLAKKLNIPFIMHGHSKFNEEYQNIVPTKLVRKIMINRVVKFLNSCTSVWPVSDGCKNAYEKMGVKGNLLVCRNATDLIYPKNAEELVARTGEKYNLKDKKNILLFLSRLDTKTKNIDYIIDACYQLKRENFEFYLILTGDGQDKKSLQSRVQKLGMEDEVLFTGTVSEINQKMGLYLSCDLFLFPSVVDTCGLVVLEAAAMNKPSVLIRNSSPAEMAKEKHNCFTCELDANDLAMTIKDALKDPERLEQIGKNAQTDLGKSWEQTAVHCINEYQRLLLKGKKAN